ncbi:uncharacterized protein LOC110450888 isoform X2 [Mizuhopecten yessoensis]|uniref:BTB domain-containing protein n=2 Tax=Mizuhopecten yessoensis TaxID=6573 RepID=A0A210QMR7_MIZYE|nr:uncharacterized protein LOC110450888 isoform X2 [Mizuhopecten yessoensis]OWF50027.1 hypothetical protein KP79_PYT23518 [Mizuhopecten yessoensis]
MQKPGVLLQNQCDESLEYDTNQSGDHTKPVPILDIEVTDETCVAQIDPGFLPNDVILVVEEKNLHVNKALLESASPVFEAWLKKEWQQDECTDDTKRKLEFPGKTYDEMATFLKCLLPFFPDKVTDKKLDTVLPLADEYRTENLITECVEVIRKHVESVFEADIYIPPSRVVTYLRWIEQYNLHTGKECVVRLASYLESEELQAVADYENVSLRLQLEVSNARAKLLESLFVCSVTEAEKKMYQFKIPHSSQYMAEWKNNLGEIVEMFLTSTPSQKIAANLSGLRLCPTNSAPFSLLSVSADSNMKPLISPSIVAAFACISICDRFKFSESYAKSITRLTSLNISKSEVKQLWAAHYSTDSDKVRDGIERHVLQMCKCI